MLPPPQPSQQRDSNSNREIRINTFDLESIQTEERFENQAFIESFPLPEERFAEINEGDLTSFDSPRTMLNQPFRSRQVLPTRTEKGPEEKLRNPFGSEQNPVQLEEPRSSSNIIPPSFGGRSLFNNFPFTSVSLSNTKDISNPAQSLFFGPPSTNINMEDGSYTIVTVFG